MELAHDPVGFRIGRVEDPEAIIVIGHVEEVSDLPQHTSSVREFVLPRLDGVRGIGHIEHDQTVPQHTVRIGPLYLHILHVCPERTGNPLQPNLRTSRLLNRRARAERTQQEKSCDHPRNQPGSCPPHSP